LVIRREVDRFLRERGAAVEVAGEFDNIENIKKGIEIGLGLALLPEPTLRQEVQAGTLLAVRLADSAFVRPLGLIHRRSHRPGSAALGFIDLLRTNGNGTPSNGAGDPSRPAHQGNGTRARKRRKVT